MDIIFDVDGTLMDIEHRRPLLNQKRPDWKSFNYSMIFDTPNENICHIAQVLNQYCHIIIATGRSEEYRELTERQLKEAGVNYKAIYFRKDGDYRKDTIIKKEMLEQMKADGLHPEIVFDDRDAVVEMWRELGLTCCQVAKGDF